MLDCRMVLLAYRLTMLDRRMVLDLRCLLTLHG
jgi:hypothetical protein